MNALTTQEKIDLLNTLKVVDWETDSGELICLMIEDTTENRAVLAQIVDGDLEDKLNSVAALETPDHIDISIIGFELAEFWNAYEKKFHNDAERAVQDEEQSEQQHLRWLELMNEAGINYMLNADSGIDFKDGVGKAAAYQLARENGLHLIMEDDGMSIEVVDTLVE